MDSKVSQPNEILTTEKGGQHPGQSFLGNTRKRLMATVAGAILSVVGASAQAGEPEKMNAGYSCKADPDCERLHLNFRPPIEMDEGELDLMNSAQDTLRENYLNPSFLAYLQKTQNDAWSIEMGDENRKKSPMAAIELAIEHADGLLYVEKRIGTVEITKRAYSSDAIPHDFKIVVENGSVIEINGKKLNPKGWYSPKQVAHMFEETQMKYQVCHDIRETPNKAKPEASKGQKAGKKGKEVEKKAEEPVKRELKIECKFQKPKGTNVVEVIDKEFLESIQIHLPHRINKLLELKRNSMGIKNKPFCPSENKDENEPLGKFSDEMLQGFTPLPACSENQPNCAEEAKRPSVRFQKNGTGNGIEILDGDKSSVIAFGFDGTVMTKGENPQGPWTKPEECKDSLKRRYLEKLKTSKKK